MAKTIKELVREYASQNSYLTMRKGELVECYNMGAENGYIAGAKAVLEEIEKCMSSKEESITDWIILIRSKIKELKG